MNTLFSLVMAISAWTMMGVFMYMGFLQLQITERDTRFPEERGKKPESNHKGRGGWNRHRPTRKPFSRLTLYADFFVAGFKTQRVALPYSAISKLDHEMRGADRWLLIEAKHPDTDYEYSMYFMNPDTESIESEIQAKLNA